MARLLQSRLAMRIFLASVGAIASLAVACTLHTSGTHHNGEFSYSNCFLGCATTTPMMLGDEEDVSVSGAVPAVVSIESSSPSIVSIKSSARECCSKDADAGTTCHTVALNDACASQETATLRITVDAPATGSSDLVIRQSDGTIWDSVSLTVEKAASLSLACNTKTNASLNVNGSCPITWTAKDGAGKGLMSTRGIALTSSDANVVVFSGFLKTNQSTIQATPQLFGDVTLHAAGAGDAVVTGTGGGATETLSVHVTP